MCPGPVPPAAGLAVALASDEAPQRSALPPVFWILGASTMALCGQSSAKCQAKLRQASLQGGGSLGLWRKQGQTQNPYWWPGLACTGLRDYIPEFGKQKEPMALLPCGPEGSWHRCQGSGHGKAWAACTQGTALLAGAAQGHKPSPGRPSPSSWQSGALPGGPEEAASHFPVRWPSRPPHPLQE